MSPLAVAYVVATVHIRAAIQRTAQRRQTGATKQHIATMLKKQIKKRLINIKVENINEPHQHGQYLHHRLITTA